MKKNCNTNTRLNRLDNLPDAQPTHSNSQPEIHANGRRQNPHNFNSVKRQCKWPAKQYTAEINTLPQSAVSLIGMHWISGSGLPDVWLFLISGSGSKLPNSEPESLLIYCVLFCNLSDFHCISTLNIQYTHCVFEFDQYVCVRVCVW